MSMPKLLYHYAPIEAFKGIIESESMRMTKYDQMNDPLEVEHARNIVISILKKYKCQPEHESFRKYLIKGFDSYKDLNLFISSFSEKSNYLEQWRAYTPNGGVAIGFDFSALDKGFIYEHFPDGNYIQERGIVEYPNGGAVSVRHPANLHKCKYCNSVAIKMVEKDIKSWFGDTSYAKMYDFLAKGGIPGSELPENIFAATLSRSIYNIISITKHSAYKGEKEWRWVNINPKPSQFTKRIDEKNRLYVIGRIHLEECIKEVWMSPHGDKCTIRDVLELYKANKKLSFRIYESKIPYRLCE